MPGIQILNLILSLSRTIVRLNPNQSPETADPNTQKQLALPIGSIAVPFLVLTNSLFRIL